MLFQSGESLSEPGPCGTGAALELAAGQQGRARARGRRGRRCRRGGSAGPRLPRWSGRGAERGTAAGAAGGRGAPRPRRDGERPPAGQTGPEDAEARRAARGCTLRGCIPAGLRSLQEQWGRGQIRAMRGQVQPLGRPRAQLRSRAAPEGAGRGRRGAVRLG